MTARGWIDILRILHGSYNTIVAMAFMYQGWLGLKVRRGRKAGDARDFDIISRHRNRGPVLVLLGILGYFAGVILIYVDKARFFAFPLHHIVGSGIVVLLTATFLIARNIKGPASPWRTVHFVVGLGILCLYLLQIYLGLNVLL